MRKTLWLIILVVLLGGLISACGQANQSPSGNTDSGSDNVTTQGATLLNERCTQCHSLSRVESSGHTLDQWKTIIAQMVQMGAQLTPQEEDTLAQYLAQTYP
jgi:hypothetical protein